jgi:hypothetical protein
MTELEKNLIHEKWHDPDKRKCNCCGKPTPQAELTRGKLAGKPALFCEPCVKLLRKQYEGWLR